MRSPTFGAGGWNVTVTTARMARIMSENSATSTGAPPGAVREGAMPEERQQLPIVRHGRRNREVVYGSGAEAARELFASGGGAAGDVGAGEVDQALLPRLQIEEARQAAVRETLLPRIDDR